MTAGVSQKGRTLLIGCAVLERELNLLTATARAAMTAGPAASSSAGPAASSSAGEIELLLIEQGMHNQPDELRRRLQSEIDRADGRFDRIIIAYGLCSNGLAGIRAGRTPLLVPRAHDCITLLIGSRQRYRDYFDAHAGTYWYSVGWLETAQTPGPDYLERKRDEFMEKYEDEDTVDYLIAEEQRWIDNYQSACFIRQQLTDDSEHVARTRAAADRFGWTFDMMDGDLGLLQDLVSGRADSDRLLAVPPGGSIAPSYDESIIILAEN